MYNNDLNVLLNTKNTIKKIIEIIFGKKNLKKIIYIRLRIRMWIIFLFSLIKLNKPNFFVYSMEGWHIGDGYEFRKQKYIKLLEKDFNCSVVHLDLHSHRMINFFLLILKVRRYNFNTYKNIRKKKLGNSRVDFSNFFKTCMWDISLRDKYSTNKNLLDLNKDSYEKEFKNFKKKIISKKLLRSFLNFLKVDKLNGIIITQECYEEWAISLLAIKYQISIILFESRLGALKYGSVEKDDIHQKNSNLFFNLSKYINNQTFIKSNEILENRTNGIYNSSSMFYMSNLQDNAYKFREIRDNAVFLFLHAFVDGPNIKTINRSSSKFIDYYHFSLWVLEFCSQNKIPLYVKPHPNRSDYISEKYFIESFKMALKKKRNENKNFYYEFVDGNFKSKEIRKFKNPVVFTGRGSVLIELAFLGIKSFSFFKSDYLNFKFVNFIQNPEKLSLSDIFFLDNKEILREKKRDAILAESVLNQIETGRIFEFKTISQLTKKFNPPTTPLQKVIRNL